MKIKLGQLRSIVREQLETLAEDDGGDGDGDVGDHGHDHADSGEHSGAHHDGSWFDMLGYGYGMGGGGGGGGSWGDSGSRKRLWLDLLFP